jgi:hypothetical protein
LYLAMFLTGCGGGNQVACHNPVISDAPQDCTTLFGASWRIGPTSQAELQLAVGDSRALWLDPFVESECAGSVGSVRWSVDDPSSASVVAKEPAYKGSWITGVGPGANVVRARIVLADGTDLTVPRAIQVVAAEPPAGSLIAGGIVDLGSSQAGPAADFRRFIPFTLPRNAGRIDIRVDWTSPLDNVDVSLSQGDCSGPAGASCRDFLRHIAASHDVDFKPERLSVPDLPADIYTLMIDNLGPGSETVRYEVRLPD